MPLPVPWSSGSVANSRAPTRTDHPAGVGDYTTSAVLAFAHRQRIPVLDTNVRRVLNRRGREGRSRRVPHRFCGASRTHRAAAVEGRRPRDSARPMELGALICTARDPGAQTVRCVASASGWPRVVRTTSIRRRGNRRSSAVIDRRAAPSWRCFGLRTNPSPVGGRRGVGRRRAAGAGSGVVGGRRTHPSGAPWCLFPTEIGREDTGSGRTS